VKKQLGRLALIAALLAALFVVGCGPVEVASEEQEEFPDREITFVVPYPAGSGPDSTARALAEAAEGELGVPIVIQNREGGSGTIGLTEVANAEPNGYTLGMAPSPALTIQWQRLDTAFKGPEQLQPILQTNIVPNVLIVPADSDIKSLEDFVKQAKENPGRLKVGVPGEFSVQDQQMREFRREAGIEHEQVRFDGGEQVLPVVNGTIDAAVGQPVEVSQYIENGDVRAIALFSDTPIEGIDAPLVSEAGYDVEASGYEGVVTTAGVPEGRVRILHDALKAAMESDRFQGYLETNKMLGEYVGTEEFEQKIKEDVEKGRELLESSANE